MNREEIELNITENRMYFLINAIQEHTNIIEIEIPPCPKIPAVSIDLENETLEVHVDEPDFKSGYSQFDLKEEHRSEGPSYDDIKSALMASGLVPPKNIDEVKKTLLTEIEARRSIPTYIVPDTNCLMLRVPSLLEITLGEKTPKNFTFYIIPPVIIEMENLVKQKMKIRFPDTTSDLKVLNNSASRKARRAHVAIAEMNYLQGRSIAIVDRPKQIPTAHQLKGIDRDAMIINEILRLIRHKRATPLAITMDRRLSARFDANGIEYILLDQIETAPRGKILFHKNYKLLPRFLTSLAEFAGIYKIRIGMESIKIIGAWPDKLQKEWDSHTLKIQGPTHSKIIRTLEKDLRISGK